MKFSIIGKGFIYPRHEQAILETGGEIREVIDNPQNPEVWKAMIAKTDADCIVILTPNHLHFEMVKAAAGAGKIVLCEKPLALRSAEVMELTAKKDIYSVSQLRYHPVAERIKKTVDPAGHYDVEINITVFRDQSYFDKWQGKKDSSGGLLFNLGVHYFDLLLYFFGPALRVTTEYLDEKTGYGLIEGANYFCKWRISTAGEKADQKRIFKINGEMCDFSINDSLPRKNLHFFVYQDLLQGKGITPADALPPIKLIEEIYANHHSQNR